MIQERDKEIEVHRTTQHTFQSALYMYVIALLLVLMPEMQNFLRKLLLLARVDLLFLEATSYYTLTCTFTATDELCE